MATGTKALLDALLKEVYIDDYVEQYNNKFQTMKRIETKSDFEVVNTSDGDQIMVPLITGRHNTRTTPENTTLPARGYRTAAVSLWNQKTHSGRMGFTGEAIKNMSSKTASFVSDLIDDEMEAMVKDMKKEQNRMAFGIGFGVLGCWESGAYTAYVPYGGATPTADDYGQGFGGTFGTRYIHDGREINYIDFAAGTSFTRKFAAGSETSGVVSAKTKSQFTLAADPTLTEATPDFFTTFAGVESGTTAPVPGEPFGFMALCSDVDADGLMGNYGGSFGTSTHAAVGGLLVASYPTWIGNAVYNGTTTAKFQTPQPLSMLKFQEGFDASEEEAGVEPTGIYCTKGFRRIYGDFLVADKRFTGSTMTLDGGYEKLTLNGVPLIDDADAIPGVVFFVHEPYMLWLQDGGIEWMDKDGGILSRVANTYAYEATAIQRIQMATRCRAGHTILWNVDEWSPA